MTSKEYLRQAYRLDHRINSDIKEMERLRDMAGSVSSPSLEERHNPDRPTEAPFVRCIMRVMELEEGDLPSGAGGDRKAVIPLQGRQEARLQFKIRSYRKRNLRSLRQHLQAGRMVRRKREARGMAVRQQAYDGTGVFREDSAGGRLARRDCVRREHGLLQ